MDTKEYKLNIDPRILELLGPSLYTNIYYVLAELIANAYDADANNVYIIADQKDIVVEDDGRGMSYSEGDIEKYLKVAGISRVNEEESLTPNLKRYRMGRKGVGKLAALSVSEGVKVLTIRDGEKSGFVLSRHPYGPNGTLQAIPDEEIVFARVKGNGTSIVMTNPQSSLDDPLDTIKSNLLKIFPLVGADFVIHIIRGKEEVLIDSIDTSYASQLCALITLGDSFSYLSSFVPNIYPDIRSSLVESRASFSYPMTMKGANGLEYDFQLVIEGWIGAYETTRGRKKNLKDFPDNFISLYANKKMGEFNILPAVGQNKMTEVFVVGQLHVDAFELTALPDMALSNRQGYKSDDPRYQFVLNYVRERLLPDILEKRAKYAAKKKESNKLKKIEELKKKESVFRDAVEHFKDAASKDTVKEIALIAPDASHDAVKKIVDGVIEAHITTLGIKQTIDSQKKRILISHTEKDMDLAGIVEKMLVYNNVPEDDIIYTHSEDERCRIPENVPIYDYLKSFFVDSYSSQKMYVLFVTSEAFRKSWGALVEVGAAWITSIDSKIFNISPFAPGDPLNNRVQWHTSNRDNTGNLFMDSVSADEFCVKIEDVCKRLGYQNKTREENSTYLKSLVTVK